MAETHGHIASPSSPTTASDLIASLRARAPRLALAIAAAQFAWPAGRSLQAKARERTRYTVKVAGNDDIYDDLHEWVLGLLPTEHQRALVAWTSKPSMLTPIGDGPGPPARLRLRYDGSREQVVTVAGHKVRVEVSSGEVKHDRYELPEIIFTTYSLPAQQALLREIERVAQALRQAARKPVFRMLTKWGDWERLDDLPERTLDSVVLPAGQLERLVADVDRFLASEPDYLRRCVPWHRGHLYDGPPGTGKTSVARAIASHFGMDIWYLSLADLKNDGDLMRVANRISPRSMLLIEDADVFHAATRRDDEGGVTLSGLLNALDGIATPHGLLTVLTTNNPAMLDKAVVRAGRIDLVEHFTAADDDQVSRLLTRWYGQPVLTDIAGMSPAEVVEVCKRHDDPAAATAELAERAYLVTGKSEVTV